MSDHLMYKNHIVDLGRSIESTRQEFKAHFENAGWQILAETAATDAAPSGSFTLALPAGEGVGNSRGRDVTHLSINGTTLSVQLGVQVNDAAHREFHEITLTMGANANYGATDTQYPSVKLNGRVIKAGSTTATGDAVFWATRLHDTLLADTEFMSLYTVSRVGNVLNATARNVGQGGLAPNVSNTSFRTIPGYTPGTIILLPHTLRTVSIDLANSFAYYLSIFSRSFLLGTETVGGYFGPIGASFAAQDAALKGVPAGCIPTQAMTFNLQAPSSYNAALNSSAVFAFGHGYGHITTSSGSGLRLLTPNSGSSVHIPTLTLPVNITSRNGNPLSGSTEAIIGFVPRPMLSIIAGFAVGSVSIPDIAAYDYYSSSAGATCIVPGYVFPDVTPALAAAPANMKLALCGNYLDARTLAAPVTATDTTLTLSDGAGLPAAGTLLIGDEVVRYAGRNGNTVTGVVRGTQGTTAQAYAVGATVAPGLWYLRLNGGMLLCGALKPGAVG